MVTIENFITNRLTVSHWQPEISHPQKREKLELALRGLLTPKVLKPLPEPLHLASGPTAISDWITARASESDVYLVSSKKRDDVLGLLLVATIADPSGSPTLHFGYLLAESAWGNGYATELVRGLVVAADGGRTITLAGGVGADNPASARVLEKAGFQPQRKTSTPETTMYVRRIGGRSKKP